MTEAVLPERRGGLRDRLAAWRDRTLADPRFQRWASGFPLTRPVARRRTRALFDLCAGFVYAQTLAACVELKLFPLLRNGPRSTDSLAPDLRLSPAAAERLLKAAAALELVSARRDGRWSLGPLGAAMLGNPGVEAMVRHHAMLYRDMADPVGLLRGERRETALASYWPYARADDPAALDRDQVADYSALMSASQHLVAEDVLDAFPLDGFNRLMDVGGGDGTFLRAVAARSATPDLILFDLPPVAALARESFAKAGLSDRARAVGGTIFREPLPKGADAVTLIRVLHDHDDAAARTILRAVAGALPPGGTLLVAEPMSGTPGGAPITDAYFGFYLLAMGSGHTRTPVRLREMLREAGFGAIREPRTRRPLMTRLLVSRRNDTLTDNTP
ncbi:Hydroxyneurosporene methyltransferase [Caenispirillum salinarum AK4]|uniref:Hydroxyneurosporene methyltransferase n=1 Tax=Caenispirillum salinarum AK4 TaxID=1238182 RepID=K9HRC7_9PROT|nr:methyltransferase [Caenispirillum salinarum]EKV32843.1 Hydroxyneurosporene methyltransferase [Caenispirillum salinarum AK4]